MSSPATDASAFDPTASRYEILGEIARSGLTTIYHARDPLFGRDVAIKVHQPGVNPERLIEEARITVSLGHPGIVPVHEVGVLPDGRRFMVMKLLKGQTFADLQGQVRFPNGLRWSLPAFEQVCQTVAFAHARGVVHRNLKPSKVMIVTVGEVLVLGWGLARVMVTDEPPAPAGSQNIIGTPAYMPPEQARGEVADERSDVFGLGGVLCAILTGEPVFKGDKAMELIRRSAAGDLADAFARLDACGADAELVVLAKRCLAPKREDRPADAGEVARAAAALHVVAEERARHTEADRARAEERRKRRRVQVLMIAFAVAAVVLLIVNAILLVSRP